jgi:archaellum component FlaF (FlaF/FlaG flagellin family)
MANPGTFGDLGKESKEALLRGKDFSSKPQVEVVTTSKNQVKATAKINREDNGSLLGSVELKLPKTNGVETTVNLDSANKIKLSLAATDNLVKGLKASLGLEADAGKNEKLVKAGLEYKRPRLTTAATFNFPVKKEAKAGDKGPSVVSSAVVGFDEYGVAAGAEGEYLLNSGVLDSHSLTLLYRRDQFVTTAFARAKGTKSFVCGGTFYSKFTNPALANAEAAAEVAYDTKAEKDNVTVTLGGAYDVNADSRLALTADTAGKLVAVLATKLNANTKLKIGSEANLLRADAAPKFFAGLAFTD